MAVSSKAGNSELQIPKKWKNRDTSPGRTKIWTEPSNYKNNTPSSFSSSSSSLQRKIPVVYYLSRNGQLEHPHFMEVPFSSGDGLYLRDVINRLNVLRGNGFASMYSWSSKRSYRNGFVWHDLSENDFIHPAHGQEYVLKGSELLEDPSVINLKRIEKTSSFRAPENQKLITHDDNNGNIDFSRRRNQSWSSVDFNEYKVYKTETSDESTRRLAADVATQTDDKRRRRRQIKEDEIQIMEELRVNEEKGQQELSRGEISPPPSDSSPETLETLMKADGPLILNTNNSQNTNDSDLNRTAENNFPSGRMKASAVLMQLISCGSISFRDCGPTTSTRDQGFSLTGSNNKGPRLPRGGGGVEKEIVSFPRVKVEDKEYFSGSLIETKKEEAPVAALKRSNSYNAGR